MTILDILKQVSDKRRPQGRKYDLPNFLFVSILAILCGARTYKDIGIFIEERFEDLKSRLKLKWRSIPRKTMINDTLKSINTDSLEGAFRIYSKGLLNGKVVTPALDGKTLRGSYDNKNGEKALHLLMAFCTNNKIILGHVNVTKDKTNEIPCAQEMIADLGLANGAVYTLDALHCQKNYCGYKKSGGEIIVQVKNNQPYLKKKLLKAMNSNRENDSITMTEKNRGRIETRTVKSFDIREQLGTDSFKKRITNGQIWDHWNKHIKSVIYVKRKTEIFDHNTKSWKVSIEDSLYAATYVDSAKQFADQIRGHWAIESNNYVRDKTLLEDQSTIRTNPGAFAILSSWALNIFRINKEDNIRSAVYRTCCSINRIFDYLRILT